MAALEIHVGITSTDILKMRREVWWSFKEFFRCSRLTSTLELHVYWNIRLNISCQGSGSVCSGMTFNLFCVFWSWNWIGSVLFPLVLLPSTSAASPCLPAPRGTQWRRSTASPTPPHPTDCASREAPPAAAPSTAASWGTAARPRTTGRRPRPPSPTMPPLSLRPAAVEPATFSPNSPPNSPAGRRGDTSHRFSTEGLELSSLSAQSTLNSPWNDNLCETELESGETPARLCTV